MDRYTYVPSGLISTSASLIGDIRTWVISRLNGVVAAPEKASGNLKERKQILYSGSQEHFQHISWNLIVKSTKLNNWSLRRVLSNWQIPTNKPRLTLLVFKYFAMFSLRNVQITSMKLLSLMLQITRACYPSTQTFLSKNIVWSEGVKVMMADGRAFGAP